LQYDIFTSVAGVRLPVGGRGGSGVDLKTEDERGVPRGGLREGEADMVVSRGTEVRPENVGLQDLTPPEAHREKCRPDLAWAGSWPVVRGVWTPRRLAKAPAALYPEDSEEKPLLDAGLLAVSQG